MRKLRSISSEVVSYILMETFLEKILHFTLKIRNQAS